MGSYFNLYEEQWDVHKDDMQELVSILKLEDASISFSRYLRYQGNPSRNRQTLYLLGFDRVGCKPNLGCNESTHERGFGYPAHQFSWDTDKEELLARAKEHLAMLRSFGIADCYNESVSLIADGVGWNQDELAAKMSETHQQRKHSEEAVAEAAQLHLEPNKLDKLFLWRNDLHDVKAKIGAESVRLQPVSIDADGPSISPFDIIPAPLPDDAGQDAQDNHTWEDASSESAHESTSTWSSMTRQAIVDEIRRVNSVDVELLEFARQQYYELYGVKCPCPSC